MNGFTKKTVGTLTLGEKLQKLRSDKRISLREVSRATQIQIQYLEYLENGDYDKLPADVYVKGFLRSYAEFFCVDEKILIKLYKREREIKNNLEKKNLHNEDQLVKKPINISPFIFTPKKIIGAAIAFVVLFGVFLLYSEINSFASAPSLIIFSPTDNAEVQENSVYIEGSTDKEARLFINDQSILVNDNGRFRENLILQKGLNVISVKAVNKFDKETMKSMNVVSNYDDGRDNNFENNLLEENEEKQEFKIDLRVEPGPVWLKVLSDGEIVFSGTMLSGAVQSFKAKEKIQISSGKGDATFVVFNGEDMGMLGADSQAIHDVVFTKEGRQIATEKVE